MTEVLLVDLVNHIAKNVGSKTLEIDYVVKWHLYNTNNSCYFHFRLLLIFIYM